MAQDAVTSTDQISVYRAVAKPAAHPCPRCGKETKRHTEGRRICSADNCREVIQATKE